MEIFVRETPQFRDEKQGEQPARLKTRLRDRRKANRDRRKSNNDGVFVTLSTQEERRSRQDRRERQDPRFLETTPEPAQEAEPQPAAVPSHIDAVV